MEDILESLRLSLSEDVLESLSFETSKALEISFSGMCATLRIVIPPDVVETTNKKKLIFRTTLSNLIDQLVQPTQGSLNTKNVCCDFISESLC